MNVKTNEKEVDFLCKALLTIETVDEARDFLNDLCTIGELHAISQRLYVAKLLYTSHVYTDIVSETGASTATISRVNRTLEDGRGNTISGRGYKLALDRLGDIGEE